MYTLYTTENIYNKALFFTWKKLLFERYLAKPLPTHRAEIMVTTSEHEGGWKIVIKKIIETQKYF